MRNVLPRQSEPFLDENGRVSEIWYRFFETLLAADVATALPSIASTEDVIVALQNAGLMEE